MTKLPHGTEDFKIIESFIHPLYAKEIADYALKNPEADDREFYQVLGLFGPEVHAIREATFPFDPDEKLYNMVDFAMIEFNNSYEMLGQLTLNRCYVNIMHEGAELASHNDQDKNVKTGTKSYIAALFLTDDYEGGELYFPEIEASIKPKRGDLVLFPGHCTNHGVNEVTKGTRVNVLAIIHELIPED